MWWINKEECCGCSACVQVCKFQSIDMQPDEEGFLYPKINREICVNCGACSRVCPILLVRETGK